jgi:hypothetical protein
MPAPRTEAEEEGHALETLDEACNYILDGVTDQEMAACVALMSADVVTDPLVEHVQSIVGAFSAQAITAEGAVNDLVALVRTYAAPAPKLTAGGVYLTPFNTTHANRIVIAPAPERAP